MIDQLLTGISLISLILALFMKHQVAAFFLAFIVGAMSGLFLALLV